MKRIVHLSDLHFGRTDATLVRALREKIRELSPDIVVISGDLTQRARIHQFEEARRFIDEIPCATVVVPGNHDVPLENVVERFVDPLRRYRKFISEDLAPTHADDEVAIMGINTARGFTRSRGSISTDQIGMAKRFFCSVDRRSVKIVVTHHPFDFPANLSERYLVRHAKETIAELATCQADLYLSGHAHVPFAGHTATRYRVAHHTALVVQAGTVVSTRTRQEPNSFNLLHVERPAITVEHFHWVSGDFSPAVKVEFVHRADGWAFLG